MKDIDIPLMTKIMYSLKLDWVKNTMEANLFEYKKNKNADKNKIEEVEKMLNILGELERYHQNLWELGMVASKHEYFTMAENLKLKEEINNLKNSIKLYETI